jgi:hypothetical protein
MDGQNYYNPDVKYTIYRIRNTVNGRCWVYPTMARSVLLTDRNSNPRTIHFRRWRSPPDPQS